MFYRLSQSLGGRLRDSLLISPAIAHEVKVAGDVAATFHIEPHHNPKAGEPAQAWFALTRKGGKIIPLAQCNCKLAVHSEPHVEGSKPLLEPSLKAVHADQYQDIPGAEIVFPKPGEYELELSGTPKTGANFQPFELSYKVIVGAGTTPQSSSQPEQIAEPHAHGMTEQPSESTAQWQIPAAVGAAVIGLGTIALLVKRQKR